MLTTKSQDNGFFMNIMHIPQKKAMIGHLSNPYLDWLNLR